jgi:NADPH2:quinone reductase
MPRALPVASRRIVVRHYGGPEQLALEDADCPAPGPGEVRIRHSAIGLNFIDTYHRTGLYPATLPAVLGSEAAGVIDRKSVV